MPNRKLLKTLSFIKAHKKTLGQYFLVMSLILPIRDLCELSDYISYSMKKNIFLSAISLFTIYSSNAQSWDWAKNIDYYCRDIGVSIGADLQGNIYITGTSDCPTGPSGSGRGYGMFWKFDNSGNILLQDTLEIGVYKSATDTNGNTYIVGNKIAKYNNAGQQLWMINNTFGNRIALHPSGGIVVMGRAIFSGTSKSIISRYDENGICLWTKIGEFPAAGNVITCDENGNSYVAGSGYIDSNTGNSGFLVKYNNSGVLLSTRTIPNEPTDVVISSDFSIYIVGHFSSDPIFINNTAYQYNHNTIYLIKYDQQDTILWYKIVSGSAVEGFTIAADNNNNVYLTGNYKNLNVDNFNLNSTDGDIFVMKAESSGNILWIEHSITTDSPQSGYPNDITVNSANEILITGAINGTHSFGAYTLSQSSMYTDLLVAKIGLGITTNIVPSTPMKPKEFNVYPNPGQGMFQISYKASETEEIQINVFNNSGLKVYSEKTTNPQKEFTKNINLSKEAKGTYYIELITDGKKSVKKIILN